MPAAEPLFSLHRFSLCVRFCPTMPAGGKQTLVCALDETSGRGFRLSLEGAALCLEVGDGSGVVRAIAGQRRCESRRWYEARLTVGAGSVGFAVADVHGLGTETCDAEAVYAPASVDWLFGAAQGPDGTIRATFNGKLEGPVLSEEGRPVAAWDFAVDVAGDTFGDGGSGRLAGRFVNAPLRAVTASKWPSAPGGDISRDHAAVHLHEDDLDDAAWPAAFTWCLPDDLPSGVYAIRLSVGAAEDFVPLFAGSRDPARRPPVAFLVPTATYLAYANDHQAFDKPHPERGIGRPIVLQPQDLYLNEHRELGLSLYDRHADGSGVAHSSLRRPILTQRPNYRRWDGGDGHGQRWFGLDLCLVDWLIARGVPFEVVTDEVIDRDGVEALANIRVALTGSQPEYASTRMLDALGAWLGAGGRLMYLGGNGFYWRAAFPPQTPWRIELRRGHDGAGPWVSAPGESRLAATGEEGGTWRSLGRPPQALVGVGFVAEGFTRSGPYRRTDAGRLPETAFVFEGTHGDVIGDAGFSGGGAAGIELDRARGESPARPRTRWSWRGRRAHRFSIRPVFSKSATRRRLRRERNAGRSLAPTW